MEHKLHRQFSWQRMLLLFGSTAAVIAWMVYLQVEKPPVTPDGTAPVVPTREAWAQFIPQAIWSVVFVLVVDAIAIFATMKRTRKLPEEEKDWEGPDPHADRAIPVEAWSPSPVMQAAIKRTIAKQG